MNFINATKLAAGYTGATDKNGREWIVVVAKGSYCIPDTPGQPPSLLEDQIPLVMTDVFTSEPGLSATKYEIDYAPRKPWCDVLLDGSCYAPGGAPAEMVVVGMRVGSLTKTFNVFGNRIWKSSLLSATPSRPEPFTVLPLSYDNAYGGVDRPNADPSTHRWYPLNHVGVGYHPQAKAAEIEGKPLPNTEEIGNPVSRPDGNYKPMAFGPIGRSWQQRTQWAGTYDQEWMDKKLPFLPDDFDERYFQCAAADQQMPHPRGGEEVVLMNLSPRSPMVFRLPMLNEPFGFHYKNGDQKRIAGVIDTIVLEPDLGRFTVSLRTSLPLRRNLHELRSITVGRLLRRSFNEDGSIQIEPKPHYESLAELVNKDKVGRRR